MLCTLKMVKSTHKAEVVAVILEEHPNADLLSIVKVYGYTCVVRTQDFSGVDKGVYITPDTLVPDTEPFHFLFKEGSGKRYNVTDTGEGIKDKFGSYYRITVNRYRGVLSQGLLLPVSEDVALGTDLAEYYGITRYEPFIGTAGGERAASPRCIYVPVYDVDSLNRYTDIFIPGEIVSVSEKINGENWRCVFHDAELHVGSHTTWKKREPANLWWKLLRWEPSVEEFCRNHPDVVVYGESYGGVGGFSYNIAPGTRRLAVFDLLYEKEWMNVHEARAFGKDLPWVPLLDEIPFDIEAIRNLAEGDSALAGIENIREGCIVKPLIERTHPEIGRVQLKLVSNTYLEGKRKRRKKK